MARILHFTSSPDDWQALLAEPKKQWRTGYSARTLAHCWEAADGFPPEVSSALAKSIDPLLANLEPILAIPEFKVPLPGGERASQNDIFVLARSKAGPVSIMVEGKVNESFGYTIEEWRVNDSPGKKKRLSFLLQKIGLSKQIAGEIRYHLLHRAVSASIEGERYRAVASGMLVHSFSKKHTGWSDYRRFLNLFGVRAEIGQPQRLPGTQVVPLFAAWIPGDFQFLTC